MYTNTEEVFDKRSDVLILDEEIVSARNVLHDVSLDLVVLEYGVAAVDEDRGRRRLEVGAEVRWWLLHVDGRDLERDRLQLGQQVEIHEVLLAKQTGALPPAVYRRCLKVKKVQLLIFLFDRKEIEKKNNIKIPQIDNASSLIKNFRSSKD